MMRSRIEKLLPLMDDFGLPGIALNPGPTLTYLTGLHFHLMERPTVLLISAEGEMALVLPALEAGKLVPRFHSTSTPLPMMTTRRPVRGLSSAQLSI
jgi:Xaa-Pro aminopeptidase